MDFLGAGGSPLMDRDNIALVCVLEDIRGPRHPIPPHAAPPHGRQLIVANTHLLFNIKRGDLKMAQLHHLMHVVAGCRDAAVARSAAARGDDDRDASADAVDAPAVFVMGDFNCTPNSALYSYMTRGPAGVDLAGVHRAGLSGRPLSQPLVAKPALVRDGGYCVCGRLRDRPIRRNSAAASCGLR